MMSDGNLSEWGEQGLTGASSAWLDTLATAVAPALVLIWLIDQFAAPVSASAGLGLYAAVFAVLLPALRPWKHG
jgi:hypothetical protein